MMLIREQTILLVSDDAALCAAARQEFEAREAGPRVAAVSSVDAARRVVEDAAPTVILLEETAVAGPGKAGPGRAGAVPRLDSVVSALAVYAPVVVIGAADHEGELAALVAAGSANFVSRAGGCLPVALGFVEQRLRQARYISAAALRAVPESDTNAREAFGEILRHELNNPLTGILGNAELLLAEVRRKNDGRLPNGGQQRLETIAALAVRLRETVRRLSEDWEARHHPAQ
jgi:signal transduction histidine kinase